MIIIDKDSALFGFLECVRELRKEHIKSVPQFNIINTDILIKEKKLFGADDAFNAFAKSFGDIARHHAGGVKDYIAEKASDDIKDQLSSHEISIEEYDFNRWFKDVVSIPPEYLNFLLQDDHWGVGFSIGFGVFMMHPALDEIMNLVCQSLDPDAFYECFKALLTKEKSKTLLKAVYQAKIEGHFNKTFEDCEHADLAGIYKKLVKTRLDKMNVQDADGNTKENAQCFKDFAMNHPERVPLSLLDSVNEYLSSEEGKSSIKQQRIGDCLYEMGQSWIPALNYEGYDALLKSANLTREWVNEQKYDVEFFKYYGHESGYLLSSDEKKQLAEGCTENEKIILGKLTGNLF
ncbi:MAG: hypothetical protein ACON5A_03585 [Candidatus Comchoanobacterales bacterium]